MRILIKNAQIVNEGQVYKSDVLIENKYIKKINKSINEITDRTINASLHIR